MAKVPLERFNRILWVSSLCRDIITVSEAKQYDVSEGPPPSEEPSTNPALDAEPESNKDFVAEIGEKMRQKWRHGASTSFTLLWRSSKRQDKSR